MRIASRGAACRARRHWRCIRASRTRPHMALRREIVDFGRLHFLNDADEIGRVRHVAIVQEETDAGTVRVLIKVIDARGVERRRAPLDAVHDIAFVEQEFGEIGAVLPGRAGDQCHTICHRLISRTFLKHSIRRSTVAKRAENGSGRGPDRATKVLRVKSCGSKAGSWSGARVARRLAVPVISGSPPCGVGLRRRSRV